MREPKNSIHHIRKNIFGVTQQEFASIAGVQQSMVSRWENDDASPTLAEINRIRQAAADGRKLKRRWDDRLFFKEPATGAAA